MSQFEQENYLGGGRGSGGEVDEETMERAWEAAAERRSTANVEDRTEAADERAGSDEAEPPAGTGPDDPVNAG